MPTIRLQTFIDAPTAICFEASRSIDLHLSSMGHAREKAIAGRASGKIDLHETVTWEARHFLVVWQMTVQISQMDFHHSFTDEMIKGPFKKMKHVHRFTAQGGGTLMQDEFDYASPFGLLGKFIDAIVLEKYMTKILLKRNQVIKQEAEELAKEGGPPSILSVLIGQKVLTTEEGSSMVAAIKSNLNETPLITENYSLYIGFETYHLNIQNLFTLTPDSVAVDRLRGLSVLAVYETAEEAIIEFSGGARLTVNLRDEAYRGPEAMQLGGPGEIIKIWS